MRAILVLLMMVECEIIIMNKNVNAESFLFDHERD